MCRSGVVTAGDIVATMVLLMGATTGEATTVPTIGLIIEAIMATRMVATACMATRMVATACMATRMVATACMATRMVATTAGINKGSGLVASMSGDTEKDACRNAWAWGRHRYVASTIDSIRM